MFVDIMIGIHPENMDFLRQSFWNLYGYSLEYAIFEGHLREQGPLRNAIVAALNIRRPLPETEVDMEQVRIDVNTVRVALGRASSRYEEILNIFLRSSDRHIWQMATYYLSTVHMPLDVAIESSTLKDITKVIAIQAIRSATDVVSRDVMLLKQASKQATIDKLTLGIRVCRMHWFSHWKQTLNEFKRSTGTGVAELRAEDGLFGELIAAMAEE
jgi:hypothetical protein